MYQCISDDDSRLVGSLKRGGCNAIPGKVDCWSLRRVSPVDLALA